MKRRRDNEGIESFDIAKYLVMLSNTREIRNPHVSSQAVEFECKTCNRKFSSFQALGGHRASHKRSKLDGDHELKAEAKSLSLATKPKTHECSICGLEFSLGQALGGHMRRHRAVAVNLGFSDSHDVVPKVPVLTRSNSKRVFLDLNLTPLENDLKLLFGKMAPTVDALFL